MVEGRDLGGISHINASLGQLQMVITQRKVDRVNSPDFIFVAEMVTLYINFFQKSKFWLLVTCHLLKFIFKKIVK